MEIVAICKRYNVGIVVWELSETGGLVTPINETWSTVSKDVQNL